MRSPRATLSETTILLSLVLFALFNQTGFSGEPFETLTTSTGEATPLKLDFEVTVEAGWLHPKSMDEDFWLIRGDKDGSIIASPINGLLFIRFTNLGSAPIMIDSYSIEVLNGKQAWVRLVTMKVHGGEVFNRGPTNDMKQACRSNIEQDTFDYGIANKNMDPRHTVRGWVFVEAPSEAALEGGNEARFNVTDVLGNQAVRSIKVLTEESQSMQPRLLHVGETKDLSEAHKQFYSEANP
jgi:hypothetical protein